MALRKSWLMPAMICITLVAFAGTAAAETETTGSKSGKAAKAEKKASPKATVYYFHGGMRCSNCIKFEKYTDETMRTTFGNAIKEGKVAWKIVDFDKPENKHFIRDYQLMTKAVVVVKMKDGKPVDYKNLTDIWQLVGDKDGFQKYIAQEVSSAIEAKQ